ncbi:hypothetical protein D082_00750 [Synechocystis sp. PCC 6714]|nr:hypothetical protein D082_00750 [Synechocystis sp. PCC 6714]
MKKMGLKPRPWLRDGCVNQGTITHRLLLTWLAIAFSGQWSL